ncbi:hypothetical protein FRC20_001749 [Serendipita sp. 405]|nr:hypothetical protein FRC20_001749 [Serendipita sp. 405]
MSHLCRRFRGYRRDALNALTDSSTQRVSVQTFGRAKGGSCGKQSLSPVTCATTTMSNITAPISGNETIDTFLSMKDSLELLLPQLQVFQSFDVLSSIGSLANEMMTSISTYEQQIAELSRQLCSKMQQYANLRASIDKNCLSYPATEDSEAIKEMSSGSSPISRCPDVILESIFEAVAEEGSHNILSLLTVSKRFHRLAMSNPLLWRKIFITINDNLTEINSLSVPYIKACLERSGDAPLDVILDCDELPGGHEFMRNYIYDLLDRSVESEQDREDISSHLAGEFRDDEDGDGWDFPLYERKLEPLLDIIHALAGPKGINKQYHQSDPEVGGSVVKGRDA